MDERYLSQIEQSRTSAWPLPLEVIKNLQEAISRSVAVLRRARGHGTRRRGDRRRWRRAGHERTAGRRAHRNGTYTRGPADDAGADRGPPGSSNPMPDCTSLGGWQTFDRYERRTYELDRLIGHSVPCRRLGQEPGAGLGRGVGKKVSRSTVSRLTEAFEEEQREINEAPVLAEVRYMFLDGQNHKVRTEFGVTDRQMLAASRLPLTGPSGCSTTGWPLPSRRQRGPWSWMISRPEVFGRRSSSSPTAPAAWRQRCRHRCTMRAARNVRVGTDQRAIWGGPNRAGRDGGLRVVHDQVGRQRGTRRPLPCGEDRPVPHVVLLPRGGRVEDQDRQRRRARPSARSSASASDERSQRGVCGVDVRCVMRRVEQEKEPSL